MAEDDFQARSQSIAEQLMADLHHEHELLNLMIRGCVELRWAVAEQEREIATAMIYNAFETYAIARGISTADAERFCDQHLDQLIQQICQIL